MIAGTAMRASSNTNGLAESAMACAAFCMPISMMMVRFSFFRNLKRRASKAPTLMQTSRRQSTATPKRPILSLIAANS